MIPAVALSLGSPLMLMFGILAAAILGCGAGYVLGVSVGRTPPATPLATSLRLTREQLASTGNRLEKASAKLNASARSELAGSTLIFRRRLSDLASHLGSLEQKSRRSQEVDE